MGDVGVVGFGRLYFENYCLNKETIIRVFNFEKFKIKLKIIKKRIFVLFEINKIRIFENLELVFFKCFVVDSKIILRLRSIDLI